MLLASPRSIHTSAASIAVIMTSQGKADAPPPYESSKDYDDFVIDNKSKELLLPNQPDDLGFAVSSTLTRGLQVPSRTATTSSGFEYPEELTQHNISKDQWGDFTQVICEEAKLSRQQWTTVVGKGLGTLAIGGLMVGFLGAIPAVLVARHIRRRKEQRNLSAAMTGSQGERLAHHISHWNEGFFRPRGLLIRVDLPDELVDDMEDMDLHLGDWKAKADPKARDKAALKARIVIIPLEGIASDSEGTWYTATRSV